MDTISIVTTRLVKVPVKRGERYVAKDGTCHLIVRHLWENGDVTFDLYDRGDTIKMATYTLPIRRDIYDGAFVKES